MNQYLSARSLTLVVALGVVCAVAVADDGFRPNVILIFAHDLGYGDVGCFNEVCPFRTPNIDRVAAGGARLTSFYVPTPYCAPSRGTILTGRYPFRHSVVRNPSPDSGDNNFGLPQAEGGPTRSGAARLAIRGRSCLTDKPSVDRHFVPQRLSGADATAAIRIPAKKTDQMLALVGDVLRQFGEEVAACRALRLLPPWPRRHLRRACTASG